MAHDNYDKFYTWNGGTLVLDPGVFAYDEPHLRMCYRTPVQATGLDRVIDPFEQRFCAKPMEMMSPKHAPVPIATAARCDTIIPGRSYCCPPYIMPNDWRVDYRALGNEGDTEVVVQQVAPTEPAPVTLSSRIQEKPILSVAIALFAGVVIGRMLER